MKLPAKWKVVIAKWVRYPIPRWLMYQAVRVIVPRHLVGVAGVPINQQGEVLLLNHVFHPVAPWGLPGGWLDRHEAPTHGVLRELYEETGLKGTLGPVVHVESEPIPPHISIAYLAYVEPNTMRLSGEILEAKWFHPTQLPSPLLPFVRHSIQSAYSYWERECNIRDK